MSKIIKAIQATEVLENFIAEWYHNSILQKWISEDLIEEWEEIVENTNNALNNLGCDESIGV